MLGQKQNPKECCGVLRRNTLLGLLYADGADRDRTDDLALRRRSLYPTELQSHK